MDAKGIDLGRRVNRQMGAKRLSYIHHKLPIMNYSHLWNRMYFTIRILEMSEMLLTLQKQVAIWIIPHF